MKNLTLFAAIPFLLITGCSSSKPGGKIKGPDAAHLHHDIERQFRMLGYSKKSDFKGSITQQFSKRDGSGRDGPYTCDDAGCWYGITRYVGKRKYLMEWPQGRQRGLISHEALHVTISELAAAVLGTDMSPGHPRLLRRKDGSTMDAGAAAGWRWPAIIRSYLPGGITPEQAREDPWAKYADGCRICNAP